MESEPQLDYALILSVLVLLAAPILSKMVEGFAPARSALDGFVMMAVIGLITLSLLPEALEHGGVISLLIALIGFSLPWLAEFVFHKSEEMTHRIILVVSALAIVVHATSDGALLAFAHGTNSGPFIATGIVMHRLGEAVTIWWLLKPIFTTRGGFAILAALAAMTVVGYLMVQYAKDWYDIPLIGYWQAFAAGSLFHIVMHPLGTREHSHTKLAAHRLGTALGLAFIGLMILSQYLQVAHSKTDLTTYAVHAAHGWEFLIQAAGLIAPLNLLIISAGILYVRLSRGSFTGIYESLKQTTPISVLLWLTLSIALTLLPSLEGLKLISTLPATLLWLLIVSVILVKMGARAFFSVLMPARQSHNHSH